MTTTLEEELDSEETKILIGEGKEQLRFETELEFIQALGNPKYLSYLAHSGVLEEDRFFNYLKYLEYWKEAEYIRYIHYPYCFFFLDSIIKSPTFRRRLLDQNFVRQLENQIIFHWIKLNLKKFDIQRQLTFVNGDDD
ncbi:hypothetical protein SNEBB_011406 [Seison nebaliae]|nr:hypothetical protein SNEBB_011406 [Seison nebaliae]